MAERYVLLVPHFNHDQQLTQCLPALLATGLPCVIVDDGSEAARLTRIQAEASKYSSVTVLTHGYNRGKGAAIKTGIAYGRMMGFTHAIQIDADGQHNINDIAKFIEVSEQQPKAIVSGQPVFGDDVPKARLYGRRVSDVWAAIETLSLVIKDCLCGFRVYPIHTFEQIVDAYYIGNRMDVDTELLVKARWQNIPIQFVKTQVNYPMDNVSHFHYLRDNLLLIRLHTRLMLGMFVRSPKLLYWAIKRRVSRVNTYE